MNKQDVFDVVLAGIRAQGGPSWRMLSTNGNVGVSCAYRGQQGRKCAVGHLIPDALYKPNMEGRVLHALITGSFSVPDYFYEHANMLQHLQNIHDTGMRPDGPNESDAQWMYRFERSMETYAHENGLMFTKPTMEATRRMYESFDHRVQPTEPQFLHAKEPFELLEPATA